MRAKAWLREDALRRALYLSCVRRSQMNVDLMSDFQQQPQLVVGWLLRRLIYHKSLVVSVDQR